MKTLKTDIIPIKPTVVGLDTLKTLDLHAICCFAATGFFLDTDTYWNNQKVLQLASKHSFDAKGELINSEPYFMWHYNPRKISFTETLDEFEELFDTVIQEQTEGRNVILPLSGGIDSRMQAVALKNHPHVKSYSYRFKGGYPEDRIGKHIAKSLGFPFTPLQVPSGYLWGCIEELANLNSCNSDFTHSRQMAFVNEYTAMGDIFSLGHWGDVLFDGTTKSELSLEEEVDWVCKKVIKKGGLELASRLWKEWQLKGDFIDYFKNRIRQLLDGIAIENSSAKLRAFKSMYWAPRWTSVNLSVFESVAPITLPFYDNRICEFICTIPEEYLADRKLQIAYIQRKSKKVASITWHAQKPFNLNNYHYNKSPYNLPYRIIDKVSRVVKGVLGKPHVSRNWELQFLGEKNDAQLKRWLFDAELGNLVSKEIIEQFYSNFKTKDAVQYSHPISILLTLAVFNKKFNR